MERLEVLAEWNIIHGYYREGICRCVELVPDEVTVDLLRRRDVKLKKNAVNSWIILGQAETVWDEEDEIVLHIRVTDPFFRYYTEGDLPEIFSWKPGKKRKQKYMLKHVYKVRRMKWEYLLLMNEWREKRSIEMKESEDRLVFKNEGVVEWGGHKGFRMVSVKQIALREQYDYTICLLEHQLFGLKVIQKQLPFPFPGRFPECPEGCIRTVVMV